MRSIARSIWASIRGDAVFMRRINGWSTMFWIVMIPVSYLSGWLNSVTYVSALSLWALVSGHWSAWQAARVEVQQQQDAQRARELARKHAQQQITPEDVADNVVQTLIERTDLQPD